MAAQDQHFITQMAKAVHNQLRDDARLMGPALIGDRQPDAHRVNQQTFADFVRHAWWNGVPEQHWDGAQYRANLLQRVGPKQLIAAYKAYVEPDVKRMEAMLQHPSMQQPMSMPMMPQMPSPGMLPPPGGLPPGMSPMPMGGGPPSLPRLMPPRPGGM